MHDKHTRETDRDRARGVFKFWYSNLVTSNLDLFFNVAASRPNSAIRDSSNHVVDSDESNDRHYYPYLIPESDCS
jgi:hypothetical protein